MKASALFPFSFFLFAFSLRASTPGPKIVFDNPVDNADIGAAATEVTLRWHMEKKKCPVWGVEVWCASDNERIFKGDVKESPTGTNEVRVAGLKPNRVYYAKVVRNWVRRQECVFTTGRPPAKKAVELPERFADASRYDVIGMPRGEAYDLALTRFRGFTRGVYLDRESPTEFITTVPCRQYAKACVLCSVDGDPSKDPAFNLRLTRHVTRPWLKMRGRALEAMCNVLVDVSPRSALKITDCGDLRLVEVPLDMGNIQDILFHDKEGDFDILKDELAAKGLDNYLDLELMGRTPAGRTGFGDDGADTDFNFTSAVTVYGLALEKATAELETKCVLPGNVFADGEKPEGVAVVRLKAPGKYALALETFDVDDRPAGTVTKEVSDSGEYRVDFPCVAPGWYRLVWKLTGPDGVTVSCSASAAILGPDTRTTEMGEQYGTWTFLGPWGSHGYPKTEDPHAVDYMSTILRKAGFRRTTIQQPPADETERVKHYKGRKNTLSDEECRRYKLGGPTVVDYPRDWRNIYQKGGESNLVAVINARLRRNPRCLVAKLFHENSSGGTVAPEAFGLEPNAKEKAASAKLVPGAIDFCRFLRKHFPQIRIVVGNSGSSGEFIAELVRHGLTEDLVDDMGMEVIGNEILPEMPVASGMQGAEHFQAMARHFGFKWGVDQCFESNFRQDRVLGAEKQASYYVRDILLAQVWRFPSVWIGVEADFANHYNFSQWGNVGLCTRWPFVYPKKSYVAAATATKMLDRVTGVRKIPTGDECVYAVEFARADGRAVTAFWTSRGEAEVKVDVEGTVERVDMYGRKSCSQCGGETPPPRKCDSSWGGAVSAPHVVASERVQYVVGTPGCVKGVSVVKRAFPEDARPADYRAVVTCENDADWKTLAAPVIGRGPEHDFAARHSWPHRTFTAATFRAVDDPEMGRCLELELPDDGKSISPMHYRYNALILRKPIRVGRAFRSVGATVKGNSGWGEVFYIFEDSKGRRTYSCETGMQGVMDRTGFSAVNFTGWNFVRLYAGAGSSVPELKCNKPEWAWTVPEVLSDPEVKLVGLGFSARMRPLFLNETKPCRQVVRIKDIGVFD